MQKWKGIGSYHDTRLITVLEPLAASEVGDSLRYDLDKWSAREATLSELSASGLPTRLSKEGFLLDKFSLIGGRGPLALLPPHPPPFAWLETTQW